MTWSRWGVSSAAGYDGNYYLDKYRDIEPGYRSWLGQADMNFEHYVRNNPDLEAGMTRDYANHPITLATGRMPETRASWGQKHWNMHGQRENRQMAYNVSPGLFIMSRGPNDREAAKAFGGWHFEHGGGQSEGRYGTESTFYNSPGERDKRDAIQAAALKAAADKVAAETARANRIAAEGAEAGRMAMSRGGGSKTQTATGAATFKGSGADASKNRRGKGRGTGQLRRPYGASSLAIASTVNKQQGTGLNIAG